MAAAAPGAAAADHQHLRARRDPGAARRLVDEVGHQCARRFAASLPARAAGRAEVGMTCFANRVGAAHGALVRHVADTAAADEDPDAEVALDLAQAVAHRRGAADEDVAVALELLERQLARRLDAGEQEAPQGVLAQIAGRREEMRRDLQAAAEQPEDVRARFAPRRGVRRAHVDGQGRAPSVPASRDSRGAAPPPGTRAAAAARWRTA